MLHVKLRVTDLALGLAYSTLQDMVLTDVDCFRPTGHLFKITRPNKAK